ncbi:uncharacterized protein LOC134234520 [Saccostrea cucullata]|uniref:uncharacterized protein LOC134234520 n=1 Tax=Saccostrea cuccullata TaxID=36930 RepID=UPI002ECFC635
MPTSIGPTYPFSKGAIQREVMASEIKVEVSRSIGLIYIDGHPSGTGFRVGNDLIITCLHVIQGAFSARPHFIDSIRVYIQFERKQHLQNIDPRKIFKFEASVRFTHQEFDFAVLELSRHEIPDVHFPPPLTSFCQMQIPSEVHLIGHPGGVQMMEDSEVFPRVIEQNNDVDTYISELSNWSVQYFPDRLDHYAELRLPPRKILFHTTFDKGSSGSPGVIIKNHKPCVVLMVRGGAPGCFYEKKFPGHPVEDRKRVEYGYAMEDIYKEMVCSTNQNIRQLSSEIFREWF